MNTKLLIAAILALAASMSLAQSAVELQAKARQAYDSKEYAKSAKLFLEAYRNDKKLRTALYDGACSLALAGETDRAIGALIELVDVGYNDPGQLSADPDFASLRGDSRWPDIVKRATDNAKKNPPKKYKSPYTLLPPPADANDIVPRLKEGAAVWLDGDVLCFARKSSASSVQLTGGLQEPMAKVAGTDIWVARYKMQSWETGFVSYGFIEDGKVGRLDIWRGQAAPLMPEESRPLKGTVSERTIRSESLGMDRKIAVYLPPNPPKSGLPAVFLADGSSCKEFAAVLEPLILQGKVRPCAIVGVFSGEYEGDRSQPYDSSKDVRAKEYVPGVDLGRFDRHMKFFTQEVGSYVTKEFGISNRREDLAVTGFSNGGAFSAAVAYRMPGFFGCSMPLSLGVPPTDEVPKDRLPRMFFAAGALESFSFSTKNVFEAVKTAGAVCSYDEFVAGHDYNMWRIAFVRLMAKAFAKS